MLYICSANQNEKIMEDIYLPYQEAKELCDSKNHLLETFFTTSTGAKYEIFTINPIPLAEIDEFRDLLSAFIATNGANQLEFQLFESRARGDNFTVVLSAGRVVAETTNLPSGVNLLTVPLHPYAQEDGSLIYGFPVDDDLILF